MTNWPPGTRLRCTKARNAGVIRRRMVFSASPIRLRVVHVDLGDRRGAHEPFQELVAAAHRKTDVGQSALIGPPRRIPNHHGQDVQSQMICLRPPQGTADHEPPVAAAEIQNERRPPTKESGPVQRPGVRELLEGRLGPLLRRQNHAGDRHAKLGFRVARVGHENGCPLVPGHRVEECWCRGPTAGHRLGGLPPATAPCRRSAGTSRSSIRPCRTTRSTRRRSTKEVRPNTVRPRYCSARDFLAEKEIVLARGLLAFSTITGSLSRWQEQVMVDER